MNKSKEERERERGKEFRYTVKLYGSKRRIKVFGKWSGLLSVASLTLYFFGKPAWKEYKTQGDLLMDVIFTDWDSV